MPFSIAQESTFTWFCQNPANFKQPALNPSSFTKFYLNKFVNFLQVIFKTSSSKNLAEET